MSSQIHRTMTLLEKEMVIKAAAQKSQREVAQYFGIDRSMVSRIMRSKDAIRKALDEGANGNRMRMKGAKHEQLENVLRLWINDVKAEGGPLSYDIVSKKAREIAAKMGISDFKASNGWIERFKSRTSLSLSGSSGGAADANMATFIQSQVTHPLEAGRSDGNVTDNVNMPTFTQYQDSYMPEASREHSVDDWFNVEETKLLDAFDHAEENQDSATSDNQENKQPVQFRRGTTTRGATCLWYNEFRFLRTNKNGNWFRCEQRTCKATALLDDVENLIGFLGPHEHNHDPATSRHRSEAGRRFSGSFNGSSGGVADANMATFIQSQVTHPLEAGRSDGNVTDNVNMPTYIQFQDSYMPEASREHSVDDWFNVEETKFFVNSREPASNAIPVQDVASTSETTVRIKRRRLEPDLENEMIESQIKQEKLRNLRLSNRLLELQIIEKERELGVSRQTERGIQCDEWTTLIGQILR
ncbi:tc5 transposase DNA-binding domain-containing protein [Ditylenchus destructor]|uniref:Tc5 transposase DNA-binding domain-containing protein n=1 Tax=Ditylenchus destructor TaxID=166010 RepID=A0AAD4MMR9_9BILA|nr:tc5 transposase DNA-binding domain-containing protein [Ditylenchus destructor]